MIKNQKKKIFFLKLTVFIDKTLPESRNRRWAAFNNMHWINGIRLLVLLVKVVFDIVNEHVAFTASTVQIVIKRVQLEVETLAGFCWPSESGKLPNGHPKIVTLDQGIL